MASSRKISPQEVEDLLKLLELEAKYRIKDSSMRYFLENSTIIQLKRHMPMIDAGEFNPNIYVVKSGVIRGTFIDGNIEKTAGFAPPGTMLMSFHCFYGNQPSFYRFEACCPSEVVRIPYDAYMHTINNHHEFALWMVSMCQNQLYYNEHKKQFLNGDARTRLIQLTKLLSNAILKEDSSSPYIVRQPNVPEHEKNVMQELNIRWKKIFRIVPAKHIASYLGITEQHLSKIKREILDSQKNLNID